MRTEVETTEHFLWRYCFNSTQKSELDDLEKANSDFKNSSD